MAEYGDLLSFVTSGSLDKVVGSFDLLSASRTVAATTSSGGFPVPKPDTYTIPNPYGAKAQITMIWSIDGVNYYPQKPFIYTPGPAPFPTGLVGATMGAMVDDTTIYFYSIHYIVAAPVNFTMYYVLDLING